MKTVLLHFESKAITFHESTQHAVPLVRIPDLKINKTVLMPKITQNGRTTSNLWQTQWVKSFMNLRLITRQCIKSTQESKKQFLISFML
jgi:hypothetical protein